MSFFDEHIIKFSLKILIFNPRWLGQHADFRKAFSIIIIMLLQKTQNIYVNHFLRKHYLRLIIMKYQFVIDVV